MPRTPFLRRPLEVALLNLNGLGLGFLYAGRWIRFVLYALLDSLILMVAFCTKAHRLPWLWATLFLLWPLWQAFDGWLATGWHNRRYPQVVIPWRWPAILAGVLALGLVSVGTIGYGLAGEWVYRQGMAAFQHSAWAQAERRLEAFTTYFTVTLNPHLRQAEQKIAECRILQQAERLSEQGNYGAAIASYQEHQARFGASEAASYVNERVAENYRLWALELLHEDQYEQALEKYRLIQEKYPATESGARVEQDLAQAYVRWGDYLLQQEAYEEAIEKYRRVMADYPDTDAASQAPLALARAYLAWGRALDADGDFLAALDRFQQAQTETQDASIVEAARQQYESALYHLSRDPGRQGWSVMDSALYHACQGQPADSPAIGYQVNETGHVRLCHDEDTPAYALPFDLQAEYPAHFLYVVRITSGSSRGRDCGWYRDNRTGERLRLYLDRPWWRVELISTLSGVVVTSKKFEGRTSYSYCPSTYTYSSAQVTAGEIHDEGEPPDEAAVSRWLRETVARLATTP